MRARSRHIYRLGIKELYSLRRDPVLVFLILYTFTFAIYTVANGVKTEVRNASIAFVDEDRTELSRRLRDAFLRPTSSRRADASVRDIDAAMDAGKLHVRRRYPAELRGRRRRRAHPTLQLNVDATAMTLAGNGTAYIPPFCSTSSPISRSRSEGGAALPVALVGAREVQSEPGIELVHRRDADHQQRHHAVAHPVRRRRDPRARARHHRAPAGDAGDAGRDHAGEDLGQRARHRRWRPSSRSSSSWRACSRSRSSARSRCSCSARPSFCSRCARSASRSRPWRGRCRSSACSPSRSSSS